MTHRQKPSKTLLIFLWIAQALLAIFLLMGTVVKWMPISQAATMMPWTGQVSPFILRLLGAIDLLGALGLVLPTLLRVKPQLTAWAAAGTLMLMISAIVFHVSRGEAQAIGINIFAGALAVLVAWGQWKN